VAQDEQDHRPGLLAIPHGHLINRSGPLHDAMEGLRPAPQRFAQPRERVIGWRPAADRPIGLIEVIEHAQPAILIGASGQPQACTEEVIRAMARHVERPIIFPLSNPTSRVEATPADLIAWIDGRALIATGSPFEDVVQGGRRYPSAQCNNSSVFPGLGLGVRAVAARRVSDAMFMAAARALADAAPARQDSTGPLLPPLSESREVARTIALAVAAAAQHEGLAQASITEDRERLVAAKMWQPRELPMRPKRD